MLKILLFFGFMTSCGMSIPVASPKGIEDVELIRVRCVTGVYEEVTLEEIKNNKVCNGKTFVSFCKERFPASYTQKQKKQIKHTVAVLKKHVDSSDCRVAYEKLKKLEFLVLQHQKLVDISPLMGLNNLRHLDLSHNNISKLKPLESLKQLSILAVNSNNLVELDVLDMPKLRRLYISGNRISSLVWLQGMHSLRRFVFDNSHLQDESYKGIDSLVGLHNAKRLEHIVVAGVHLRDASQIANHSVIRYLNLRKNSLPQIPDLASKYIHTLDMSENSISALDFISANRSLRQINFSGNRIESLLPLRNLVNLVSVKFDENGIVNVLPLANLYDLESVSFRNNSIVDLMSLRHLHQLYVKGDEFVGNPIDTDKTKNNCPVNAVSADLRNYCGGAHSNIEP